MSGGGGGGSNTTVQKADPWSGVQPYLLNAYSQAQNIFGQNPQASVSPITAEQYQGMGSILSALNGAGTTLGNTAANTTYGLLNSPYASALNNSGTWQMQNSADQLAGIASYLNGVSGSLVGNGANGLENVGAYQFGTGQQGVSGALNAMNQLTAAGDPSSNPYFQSALDAAIRPVTQNFQENVLPSITSGAIDAGQLGGSRQGIAQGIASRGYLDSISDIATNMGNSAYGQGLSALSNAGSLGSSLGNLVNNASSTYGALGSLGNNLYNTTVGASSGAGSLGNSMLGNALGIQGLGLNSLPTALNALTVPGQAMYNWGQTLQGQNQNYLSAPYSNISNYLGLLTNGASLGGTSSSSQGGGSNWLTSALGGGLAGYGIGGPWGAAGGALLGILG